MQTKRNTIQLLFATGAATAWFFVCAPAALAFTMPAECTDPVQRTALAKLDSDNDGLDDATELCVQFTDPHNADTDGDGHKDGDEIAGGFSPRFGDNAMLIDVDSDGDYLNDAWELKLGTGLMNPDTDGDLFLDGTEVAAGFDPLDTTPVQREKKIVVDDKGLKLTYSFGDTVLGVIPVSTGKTKTPTPHGDFTVLAKVPVKAYVGPTWNYPNTKYNLWFTSKNGWRYYIHSAYWHNKFGKSKVSGGCVNARLSDMGPLYWFAQNGTKIHIE